MEATDAFLSRRSNNVTRCLISESQTLLMCHWYVLVAPSAGSYHAAPAALAAFMSLGGAQKGCLAFPNSSIPEAFLEVDGEGFRKPRPLPQKPALLSVSEIASKSMWKKKRKKVNNPRVLSAAAPQPAGTTTRLMFTT